MWTPPTRLRSRPSAIVWAPSIYVKTASTTSRPASAWSKQFRMQVFHLASIRCYAAFCHAVFEACSSVSDLIIFPMVPHAVQYPEQLHQRGAACPPEACLPTMCKPTPWRTTPCCHARIKAPAALPAPPPRPLPVLSSVAAPVALLAPTPRLGPVPSSVQAPAAALSAPPSRLDPVLSSVQPASPSRPTGMNWVCFPVGVGV